MNDHQKWSSESLAKIQATPWDIHNATEPEVLFPEAKTDDQKAQPEAEALPRRVYIKASDIDSFGHTVGCPRCEHAIRHGHGETSKPHSETCRARFMGEFATTAED